VPACGWTTGLVSDRAIQMMMMMTRRRRRRRRRRV
jgi:hypothetical protein